MAGEIVGKNMTDLYQKVDFVQEEIVKTKAEMERIESLPISGKDAAERAANYFDQIVLDQTEVKNVRHLMNHFIRNDTGGITLSDFIVFQMFYSDRERTRELFVNTISQMAEAGGGLSRMARLKAVRSLQARLTELEQEEEQLISEIEQAGAEIIRRPDADPRIVLGVQALH